MILRGGPSDGVAALVAGARYVDDLGTRSGAAYFFRLENGQMVERDKVLASNGETDDEFGIDVDIDGNVAVVGARFGNGLAVDSGAAYVFRRSGTQWNQEALLQASDGELDDGFGISVAVDGDRILVGAFLEDQGGSSAGAAYVFDYRTRLLLTSDSTLAHSRSRSMWRPVSARITS